MGATKRKASSFVTFVFLTQLLFDGIPLITRSSRMAVDGTVSTATCECASCGATICRSACKHDCSQCCRCCIYFEIRVGRRDVDSYLDYPLIGVGRDVELDEDRSAAAQLQSQLLLRRRRRQVQRGDGEKGLNAPVKLQVLNSWSLLTNDTTVGHGHAAHRAALERERENASARRDLSSKSYMKALQTVWSHHQGSTSVNPLTSPSAAARQRSVDASNIKRLRARGINAIESSQPDAGSSPPSPLASPTKLHQALDDDSGDSTHHLPCRVTGVTTIKSLGLLQGSLAPVSTELCGGTQSSEIHQLGRRQH